MRCIRKTLVVIGSILLPLTLLAMDANERLSFALIDNDPARVKQALDDGALVNRVVEPQSGMMLLDSAISYADVTMRLVAPQKSIQMLEIVELLLEKGADVNAQGYQGYTPLMVSTSSEIVELLLRYGADPTRINSKGESALSRIHHYCFNVHELFYFYPVLLEQAQEQPSNELLHQCIEKEYFTLVKLLLAKGVAITLSDLERAQARYAQTQTVRAEIILKLLKATCS
jgi:hypothetical protein